MFTCRYTTCDVRVSSAKVRNAHERITHFTWKCPTPNCSSELSKFETYQKHRKICTSDSTLLSCHTCGRKFKNQATLTPHLLNHQDFKTYPCDTCAKTFETKKGLAEHRARKQNKGQYPCNQCDSRFSAANALNRHILNSHKSGDGVPCTICDRILKNKKTLTQHLNLHKTKGLKVTSPNSWASETDAIPIKTLSFTPQGEYLNMLSWHPSK